MSTKPRTRPKNTITFEQALAQLSNGADLKAAWLRGFNDLSDMQLQGFREQWAPLSSAQRVALTSALLDLATNDIEMNFNAIFRVVLKDADPVVRKNAVDGLGEEENIALIDPLIDLLKNDPAEEVRAAAASALGRFALLAELERLRKERHTQIYKALLSSFRAAPEDSLLYQKTLESLGNMSNDTVAMYIRAAFASDNPDTRRSALIAMGRSQDRRFAEFVRSELQALQPDTRLAAVEAIGELEDEEAVRDLKSLLDDSDRLVQLATLTALAQIGSPDAKATLQQAVLSADEEFSKAAGEALEMYEFWRGEIDFSITNFDEEDLKPRRVWKRRDTAAAAAEEGPDADPIDAPESTD